MEHIKLTLLITSFIIPLILAITLLCVSSNNYSRKVIGIALINTFLVFLANYLYFQELYPMYSRIHSIHIATVLWIFPSVYLYVISVTSGKEQVRKDLWHLLPGVIFGIISALLFYGPLNHDDRIYYLTTYRSNQEFTQLKFKIIAVFRLADVGLLITQVVYYSVRFIQISKKHQTWLLEEFSNTRNYSIAWLKWFTLLFVLVGMLSILFYVLNPFKETNNLFLLGFLSSVSMFIWLVGLWSFKQEKPELAFQSSEHSSTRPDPITKDKLIISRLIAYFNDQAPYLQPDLTLTSVSRALGTNRTYLSSSINSSFNMNFNALINQYRTKYITEYLREHPDASYQVLAQIGGFGSVSTLKRALKRNSR